MIPSKKLSGSRILPSSEINFDWYILSLRLENYLFSVYLKGMVCSVCNSYTDYSQLDSGYLEGISPLMVVDKIKKVLHLTYYVELSKVNDLNIGMEYVISEYHTLTPRTLLSRLPVNTITKIDESFEVLVNNNVI